MAGTDNSSNNSRVLEFPNQPGRTKLKRTTRRLPKKLPVNVIRFEGPMRESLKSDIEQYPKSGPDPEVVSTCRKLLEDSLSGKITGIILSVRTRKWKNGVWLVGDLKEMEAAREAAQAIYESVMV